MLKLLATYLKLFLIAIAGVASIRVVVILFVTLLYGGHWPWGLGDVWFVLKQGTLLAGVFWVFATVSYLKNK
ncbi:MULTISPECIES: hypothetical protein [unclassified Paraburkholderia]|uniref:hypothetical protein n=1 Tax=unclassified Paraburkholderia TaxID=2615204 RepID=UPI002AB6C4E4|nr:MULTISPECIES: hypothetical protein [unclassified Paraburkholderia]